MKCIDVASEFFETLAAGDSVARAAEVMAESGVGFLPICDADQKVLGVVTDRDLVIAGMAKGLDPKATPVTQIMSTPAITCLAEADLRVVEDLMAEERKARIVLIEPDGRLAGVVSIADIIEKAPKRQALRTLKAVLWREALGPRAGAPRGQPLLQDEPLPARPPEEDLPHSSGSTVFAGGHHDPGMTEFP
jgi:CBS-domain-containing membrane protein